MAQIFINPSLPVTAAFVLGLGAGELLVPVIAERLDGGTPWHPHNIAEHYGLLVIITLGEVILGTILAISAVIEGQGWSVEAGSRCTHCCCARSSRSTYSSSLGRSSRSRRR